jgi:hypothetical protein
VFRSKNEGFPIFWKVNWTGLVNLTWAFCRQRSGIRGNRLIRILRGRRIVKDRAVAKRKIIACGTMMRTPERSPMKARRCQGSINKFLTKGIFFFGLKNRIFENDANLILKLHKISQTTGKNDVFLSNEVRAFDAPKQLVIKTGISHIKVTSPEGTLIDLTGKAHDMTKKPDLSPINPPGQKFFGRRPSEPGSIRRITSSTEAARGPIFRTPDISKLRKICAERNSVVCNVALYPPTLQKFPSSEERAEVCRNLIEWKKQISGKLKKYISTPTKQRVPSPAKKPEFVRQTTDPTGNYSDPLLDQQTGDQKKSLKISHLLSDKDYLSSNSLGDNSPKGFTPYLYYSPFNPKSQTLPNGTKPKDPVLDFDFTNKHQAPKPTDPLDYSAFDQNF